MREKLSDEEKKQRKKQRQKQIDKKWYEENKEYKKEYQKKWREENPDYRKKWYEKNKERRKEQNKKWYKENPEKVKAKNIKTKAKRRMQVNATQIPYTLQDVFQRYGYICGVCSGPIDPDNYHIDHVIPLSKGGHDTIENVRPCHPACNLSKNAKLLEELDPLRRTPLFSAHVERLSEKIAEK